MKSNKQKNLNGSATLEKTSPYLNKDALGGLPEPQEDVGGAAGRHDILAAGGQVQDAADGVLILELVAPDQPARVRVQGGHHISRWDRVALVGVFNIL